MGGGNSTTEVIVNVDDTVSLAFKGEKYQEGHSDVSLPLELDQLLLGIDGTESVTVRDLRQTLIELYQRFDGEGDTEFALIYLRIAGHLENHLSHLIKREYITLNPDPVSEEEEEDSDQEEVDQKTENEGRETVQSDHDEITSSSAPLSPSSVMQDI